MDHIAPSIDTKSFTCPHCGTIARQYHFRATDKLGGTNNGLGYNQGLPVHSTVCEHCNGFCLWYKRDLVYPNRGDAPSPNPDMPAEVKSDYEEAAAISLASPRGAAALVRLAIQKLSVHLGGKGKNINDDIGKLVKNGLPETVQQALDVVRVVGNNAVHPGQIDTDDPEVASNLFSLTNLITQYMISMPGKVKGLFEGLPDSAKEAIEKRDS